MGFVSLVLTTILLASPCGAAAESLWVLTPAQIDAAHLLPPPPSASVQAAELAELRDIQAHHTPERLAQARWDDQNQSWRLFAALLGPRFDMATLPATAKVLATVNHDMAIASVRAKRYFKRPRPWSLDPTLNGCPHRLTDDPLTSYPSGHTLYAFSVGVVLADLMPGKAGAILDRARDFAYSRLVCGVHYRSDTVAGQAMGTVIGQEILQSPAMQADLAAARAELKAAGLTGG
jgi:membrane-associated phospholipid phosphatase